MINCNVHAQWTLIWSDEFNENKLDDTKWIQETGGNGWGNNESQFYTAGSNNLNMDRPKRIDFPVMNTKFDGVLREEQKEIKKESLDIFKPIRF